MVAYLVRRLSFLVFVVIGVTLLVFAIGYIVPADPARAAAGLNSTEDQVQALRELMGLDKPLHVQYWRYLTGLLRLDFGRSVRTLRPIAADIAKYYPATVELVLVTMVLYVGIGLPLGVISAVRRGSWFDRGTRLVVLAGIAMPEFWLALALQYLFFGEWGILPSGGRLPMGMDGPDRITGMYTVDSLLTGNWEALGLSLRHLALPALCLTVRRVGVLVRVTQRTTINVLYENYVTTARAKGLRERVVVWRHIFRNVLVSVVTLIGLQMGWLLGSAVVVEMIFTWPGVGWYAADSIAFWDFPAVISVVLVIALSFVGINMVVDLVYVMVDPRVRQTG
jgi:peptide/nickel transport system permease protein